VQQALLKMVEGTQVKLSDKSSSGRDKSEETVIDTRNVLFIAGGAFSGLESLVEKRLKPARSGIGFHAPLGGEDVELPMQGIFTETHSDDLKRFGLIPEFIGRFPLIAGLEQLDEEALVQILSQPKNALLKQYTQLFTYDDVELEFTPEALREIAVQAISTGTGARGLRSIMESILQKAMFEVPSRKSVKKCIVDEDVVTGVKSVLMLMDDGKAKTEKAEENASEERGYAMLGS
jgi:ATP-dependent Clp protease ATP-binding subunit ClpX